MTPTQLAEMLTELNKAINELQQAREVYGWNYTSPTK